MLILKTSSSMGIIFPITFAFDIVHWQVDLGNTAVGCFGRETHSKFSQ